MIPSDVASSLRQILPDQQGRAEAQTLPVAAAQKVADVLSNLVPGQRVLAEIQAMLPNGNYRAVVAQRDITLALPFSAKAGDTLELEVTESDGKLALAFVTNRSSGEQAGKLADSSATTLSQTGKLIGDLLNGISDQGKRAAPAPLNGNLPLVEDFPDQAANLAPILKDALTKSGVFYESHQARWVAGELPTAALKQEPQGRFSTTPQTAAAQNPAVNALIAANNAEAGSTAASSVVYVLPNNLAALPPGSETPDTPNPATVAALKPGEQPATPGNAAVDANLAAKTTEANKAASALANTATATQSQSASSPGNPIPRDLVPIVQQQLDALSTQNYAWQGQIWPGQQMQWEIGENLDGGRSADNESIARWQTRLKLSLPMLGGINAVLRLNPAGEVNITVTADSVSSEARLRENGTLLSRQMEAAGLNLTQLLVEHGEAEE